MLRIERISKSFGSRTLLDRVSAQVQARYRIGLVGRNGEGKTTLLRIIGGLETADDGRIVLEGEARIGYQRHELRRCAERESRYLLLVWWDSIESHTEGFRGSPDYQRWKALLHHFYDPFPTVEHYARV